MYPVKLLQRLLKWYSEGISRKTRVIILILILLFLVSMGIGGYKMNNYFETNPNACVVCHVHDYAQQGWLLSKHAVVTCHECHHASKRDQVEQIFRFVVFGVNSVSPRHGKVIVPWKLCIRCHWEKNDKYPEAPLINKSRFHAKHLFMEQIECSKCHGYFTHQFPTEKKFCVMCHEEKEVYGTGMEHLPCLNCHTDRTKDLRPDREKCLFCHGNKSVRDKLIAGGTIDVKRFLPTLDEIEKAAKIDVPSDAPMQFYCYECHKPHEKARPAGGDCLRCHSDQLYGKHELHSKNLGMKCMDCHRPHRWKVTQKQAKKDCTKCHDYKDPSTFVGYTKGFE
jgi:hypothetical protein